MADKTKSTFYLPREVVREMEIEGARVGKKFPSKFILFHWEHYKKAKPAE